MYEIATLKIAIWVVARLERFKNTLYAPKILHQVPVLSEKKYKKHKKLGVTGVLLDFDVRSSLFLACCGVVRSSTVILNHLFSPKFLRETRIE